MSTVPPADGPSAGSPAPGAYSPQQIVLQQEPPSAFGRYGKVLLVLLGITVMSLVGLQMRYEQYFSPTDKPQEKYHSLSKSAREKIAIITASGTIMGEENFTKKQIDRVRDDDNVVAVVLRVDSPGGTVTGSDYLYHHLLELREKRKLPLVVSMGSMCASGGYYIAMAVGDQEDSIYAEPTTWTGSVGVVIPHYDFSGLLASYNVKDDSIASNPDKLMGSPTRELTAEERAKERQLLQDLVNISFERFKEIVRSGRPKLAADAEDLTKATTGQIFTAQQALDLGLVDQIGFLEEAVNRAAELAGKDVKNLRCVKYEQPGMSLTQLLSAKSAEPQPWGVSFENLLDLTAPRAYYLCTWLPAILSNTQQ